MRYSSSACISREHKNKLHTSAEKMRTERNTNEHLLWTKHTAISLSFIMSSCTYQVSG